MAEYTDTYIADVTRYVRNVEQAADRADDFGDRQDKAALASRRMATAANDAGDKANRAQRQAAEGARVYERAAKDAGDRAARAQQQARSGGAGFRAMAKNAATAFTEVASSGIAMKVAVAAAIAALPLAATAAGAAAALGFGAAIAGIGIAVAAQNAEVRAEFSGLKDHVLSNLQSMARPFEGTLIRLAGRAGQEFDRLGPSIRNAFANAAPLVERFGQSVLGSVGNLGPFIDRMTRAFNPLMGVLSARLPGMIGNLTNQFARMAESVDPRSFDRLLSGVNGLVTGAGNLVVALQRAAQAYAVLEGKSQASIRVQEAQKDVWRQIGEGLGLVNPQVSQLIDLNNSAAGSWRNQAAAAQLAAEKMRAWNTAVLASYNSEIALEQSIDDANRTIRDNGKTLDINTQKGRENNQGLLNIAAETLNAAEAAKKSGADTSTAMNRGYNAFIKAATGAGATRAEAKRLATQIGLVPGGKKITFTTNAKQTKATIAAVQARIDSLHGKTIVNRVVTHHGTSWGPGNRKLGADAAGGYIGMAAGGYADAHAHAGRMPAGGMVFGAGTGTSDDIPRWLSNGEYVVNAAATRQWRQVLDAINYGKGRPASAPVGVSSRSHGGGTVINISMHIAGTVKSERDLIEGVRQGLALRSTLTPGRNGALAGRAV